jgi:hypothetical protein
MSWIVLIGLAVVVAGIAAVTGIKPKGSRPVARTRLMGVGRIALIIFALILVYLAMQSR